MKIREVLVLRHRFASEATCDRLFERIMSDDPVAAPLALVAEAWLRGKVAPSARLDAIGEGHQAGTPPVGNRRARRARGRGTVH